MRVPDRPRVVVRAGSNRRPSACRGWGKPQVRVYARCQRAPYVPHQCLTTMDLGSRATLPCAARSDSAEAISASRPSMACGYR